MESSKNKISIFFYLLMAYAILQFFWWTFLIFELNTEIIELEEVILQLSPTSEFAQSIAEKGSLDRVLTQKKWMILGEGSVFLIILLTGFYLINRSHQKEVELAQQEQNFMLAITHEFNSPLAAIKLNIETLLKRNLGPKNTHLALTRTAQETERLNHLVNNILAASRMEKTGFELYPEKVDLVSHLRQLIKKYKVYFPQEIKIVADRFLEIEIDILSFELILQNLIENASKYSSPDCIIEVRLFQEAKHICLKVIDTGMGISDNEKEKVLQKFYRVGDESTRKSKGTGLGLYLVYSLVVQMGGNLSITDNQPNGTIFQIEIPI